LLSAFLRQNYYLKVASESHGLSVDSECSAEELQRRVSKFIYHRHLNNEYWAAIEHGAVKIRKFQPKKSEKKKKPSTPPSTIKHGW
jgi:hypothetical protein